MTKCNMTCQLSMIFSQLLRVMLQIFSLVMGFVLGLIGQLNHNQEKKIVIDETIGLLFAFICS